MSIGLCQSALPLAEYGQAGPVPGVSTKAKVC
jgi:hypothetical protein